MGCTASAPTTTNQRFPQNQTQGKSMIVTGYQQTQVVYPNIGYQQQPQQPAAFLQQQQPAQPQQIPPQSTASQPHLAAVSNQSLEIRSPSRGSNHSNRSRVMSPDQEPIQMTKEVLSRFIALEYELKTLMESNPLKRLEQAKEELVELERVLLEKQQKLVEHQQITYKEYNDVIQVEQYFKQTPDYEIMHKKEQEEYLAALNRQEIAKKEVDLTQQTRDAKGTLVQLLQRKSKRFLEVQLQHDRMMASIFGDYGSSEEERLETELDALEDRKQRIAVANHKWTTSSELTKQAASRLYAAVQTWYHLASVPASEPKRRYQFAHTARHHLVLAINGLKNTQSLLHTIDFPYLKPPEVETLALAIDYIYTDMVTQHRYTMAYKLYYTSYQRAEGLLSWIKHVLSVRISEDFKNVVEACKLKETELRTERLTLMKNKVEAETQEKVDIDIQETAAMITMADASTEVAEIERVEASIMAIGTDDANSIAGELAFMEEAPPPEPDEAPSRPKTAPPPKVDDAEAIAAAEAAASAAAAAAEAETEAARESAAADDSAAKEETKEETKPTPAPAPKLLVDLAPPPTQEDLFGNIDALKREHQEQVSQFQKAQDLNKARMEHGLQAKLAARKSRKMRQEEHEKELAMLKAGT